MQTVKDKVNNGQVLPEQEPRHTPAKQQATPPPVQEMTPEMLNQALVAQLHQTLAKIITPPEDVIQHLRTAMGAYGTQAKWNRVVTIEEWNG